MNSLFSGNFPDKFCDSILTGQNIISLISETGKSSHTVTSKVFVFGSRNQLSTVYFKNSHKPVNNWMLCTKRFKYYVLSTLNYVVNTRLRFRRLSTNLVCALKIWPWWIVYLYWTFITPAVKGLSESFFLFQTFYSSRIIWSVG